MRRVFRLPAVHSIAREVDDELAFHLEMRTQRLVACGMSRDAAQREALRQFGSVETVRQDCVIMDEQRERAMSRANWLGELQQDIVYAVRTLRRNAGFTAVVVIALALGIGANTAIFSLIDAVVMRTLPVRNGAELVAIGDPSRVSSLSQGAPRTDLLSTPLYQAIRDNARSFTGVLASGRAGRIDARIDAGTGESEHPRARFVSANYFSVLGVPAAAGRVFDGSEDRSEGASPTITISYAYWTRRFQNDPSAIGRTIVINDNRLTIIGVTPPSFTGEIVGASPDLWIPISMHDALYPNQRVATDYSVSWLLLLGRLRPGATLAQAAQEVPALIMRTVEANVPGEAARSFLVSKPQPYVSSGAKGFSRVRATFEAPLFTLMVGVALLLCIICANVANLLLARAIARGKEMAVRLALGADRSRLVRQLMTESVMLAMFGAGAGLLLAWWGSHALLVLASDGSSIPLSIALDGRVLVFTLVTSFLAVGLFGLAPAVRASRVDLASTMRASSNSASAGSLGQRGARAPLGKLLIAGQVALSVVLLVGAAMLVRSLRNVQSVDVGLDRDHLVIVGLDINARGYRGMRQAMLAHALRDRISAIPGVSGVAFSDNGIFSGSESQTTLEIPGFAAHSEADTTISMDFVSPGYAQAIGARMISGRELETADEAHPARVAVVNQALAQFYFPGDNAIGKYLHFQDSIAVEIVGVMADTRDHALDGLPARRAYFSYVRTDTAMGEPGSMRFEVRTSGDPSAVVQQVRQAIVAVDPTLPIDGIDPLALLMRQSIREERLVARLASAFGVLALLLAGIGLYGVMTYAISRRTGEIGLRVALGAQGHDVVRMVLYDALRLVAMGMIVGLPLALLSTRLLRNQLHDVQAVDPVSIGAAVLVLTASAVFAVLIPAVRASRVSPMVALHAD